MSIIVNNAHRDGIPSVVVEYLKGLGLKEYGPPEILYSYRRIDDQHALVYTKDITPDETTNDD